VNRARELPQQDLLEEVAAMPLGAVAISPAHVVPVAEQLMRGTLNLPGFALMAQTLPFSQDDLVRGLPTFQLAVESLVSRSAQLLAKPLLYTLNGIRIPEISSVRHAKALVFDEQRRRPDDTLPMFGDTLCSPRELGLITGRSPRDDTAGSLCYQTHAENVSTVASWLGWVVGGLWLSQMYLTVPH